MVSPKKWVILFSKQAQKDSKLLKKSKLKSKVGLLLDLIEKDPFISPPNFKKLVGDFDGYYSRRINIQHRIVYSVDEANHLVRVISMWHHYAD
jgi:Txe/YoeB family toxin of toxin-antitoxin system